MNILVIDIGGTNVKVWTSGEEDRQKFPSGKTLTPEKMVDGVRKITAEWQFERVSLGYPGDIINGHPATEPWALGKGWVGFDYGSAFGCPVRIMNDACMQALGSYEGGRMLYLGFGTNLGTAFVIDGKVIPLALGHLKFTSGESFNELLSRKGLELNGVKRWRKAVAIAAEIWKQAFLADYVVLGGGNAKKIEEMPEGCRRGGNHNAYFGGIRMWEDATASMERGLSIYPERFRVSG